MLVSGAHSFCQGTAWPPLDCVFSWDSGDYSILLLGCGACGQFIWIEKQLSQVRKNQTKTYFYFVPPTYTHGEADSGQDEMKEGDHMNLQLTFVESETEARANDQRCVLLTCEFGRH